MSDHAEVLRDLLASESPHAGKGYPLVERRIAALEAAIAALAAPGGGESITAKFVCGFLPSLDAADWAGAPKGYTDGRNDMARLCHEEVAHAFAVWNEQHHPTPTDESGQGREAVPLWKLPYVWSDGSLHEKPQPPGTVCGDALPVSELVALLPGPYYMDPPDGGDVPVIEQLRRMAEDAARWQALIGSARVRVLGSAGLHSELNPYGEPWNGYAHIGVELHTQHAAGHEPSDAVEWLTKYADAARLARGEA